MSLAGMIHWPGVKEIHAPQRLPVVKPESDSWGWDSLKTSSCLPQVASALTPVRLWVETSPPALASAEPEPSHKSVVHILNICKAYFLCVLQNKFNSSRCLQFQNMKTCKSKQFETLLCGSNGHKRPSLSLVVMETFTSISDEVESRVLRWRHPLQTAQLHNHVDILHL